MTTNERRLWEYRWVQDLFWVVLVLLFLAVAYSVRAVTLPILIGLALAYAFDPLVAWAKARLRLPRWLTTLLVMFAVLAIVIGALLCIIPGLVAQTTELSNRLPAYRDFLIRHADAYLHTVDGPASASEPAASEPAASQPATQPAGQFLRLFVGADFSKLTTLAGNSVSLGLGLVGTTLSLTAYLALGAMVTIVCFFYFSWKFDRLIAWFAQFIPPARREGVLGVIRNMDRSVSAFFRGRIIQAILVGLELALGWWIVGVPYWLLLGVAGGLLHLVIPYGAAAALPVAILLTWINTASGGHFHAWQVLIWPSVVYFIAQGLDGWVIEPLVQGKATELDPLSVMLAVLIGGSLAGLLGMMVAVPAAACVKILASQVVLPRVRAQLGATKIHR